LHGRVAKSVNELLLHLDDLVLALLKVLQSVFPGLVDLLLDLASIQSEEDVADPLLV